MPLAVRFSAAPYRQWLALARNLPAPARHLLVHRDLRLLDSANQAPQPLTHGSRPQEPGLWTMMARRADWVTAWRRCCCSLTRLLQARIPRARPYSVRDARNLSQ